MHGWRVRALIAALLFTACGRTVLGDSGSGSTGSEDVDPVIDDDDDVIIDDDDDVVIDWPPIPYCDTRGIPATSQLPRLKNAQYDNTVRDLTGVDTEPSRLLAPDSIGSMDSRSWDGYRNAASYVAEQVMSDERLSGVLIPCSSADADCSGEFIREFGLRAYRRPLTEVELTRYEDLYANRAELTENGTFEEALQMLLEVFLISPSFLMRNELAQVPESEYFVLSSYEVASRLSYMLWDSMPDEALLAAAEANELQTREAIAAQAERMLQDPKARTALTRFHRDYYMRMGPGTRWSEMTRDPDRYPTFDAAQVPLLSEETERLFDYVVFESRGTFQELLTTPVGFVNADLAPLYGLDPTEFGSNLERVEVDPELRPGVFTRAGFLASHSLYDRTSPTQRGTFLQKEVLCTRIPPPPPETANLLLPTDPNLATVRERLETAVANPACIGCHQLIDPAGYALEGFDAVGAVQTTDNDQGVPVDTNASVPMGEVTVQVDGASELMNMLAASPNASICYAEKWVEHAYQRQMNEFDQCVAFELARQLYNGYPVVTGLVELTQADSFRMRARAP